MRYYLVPIYNTERIKGSTTIVCTFERLNQYDTEYKSEMTMYDIEAVFKNNQA